MTLSRCCLAVALLAACGPTSDEVRVAPLDGSASPQGSLTATLAALSVRVAALEAENEQLRGELAAVDDRLAAAEWELGDVASPDDVEAELAAALVDVVRADDLEDALSAYAPRAEALLASDLLLDLDGSCAEETFDGYGGHTNTDQYGCSLRAIAGWPEGDCLAVFGRLHMTVVSRPGTHGTVVGHVSTGVGATGTLAVRSMRLSSNELDSEQTESGRSTMSFVLPLMGNDPPVLRYSATSLDPSEGGQVVTLWPRIDGCIRRR